MENTTKALEMVFATKEGGSFRISVANTLDDLTPADINQAMDTIVNSNVFKTNKGEVVGKAGARYITQEIQELNME